MEHIYPSQELKSATKQSFFLLATYRENFIYFVANFNHWNGRMCTMRSMCVSGIWELFVPGIGQGEKYKFEIRTREGYLRVKSDPMAFYSELRPLTASVVFDVNAYEWRSGRGTGSGAMNVYEVHLG